MKRKSLYRKKIHRIASAAIMVICVWGIAGHMLWDITRQACYQYVHHIKKERSFRDTLALPQSSFYNPSLVERIKKDEIRYGGRMFDIKHEIQKGDSTILVGHYDDFEHHLYKSLQNLFDDDGTQIPKNVKQSWQTWVAVLIPYDGYVPVSFQTPEIHHLSWSDKFHDSLNIPPLHAPPDLNV